MAKNQKSSNPGPSSIDIGQRQKQVEVTTSKWRETREALKVAQAAFDDAKEKRETAIALFNQDIDALKSACGVSDE